MEFPPIEHLIIALKAPMGWKTPKPATKVLSGMSADRFEELFDPAQPKAQIIDASGDLLDLTHEFFDYLNGCRDPLRSSLQPGQTDGAATTSLIDRLGPMTPNAGAYGVHPPVTDAPISPVAPLQPPLPQQSPLNRSVYLSYSHHDESSLAAPLSQTIPLCPGFALHQAPGDESDAPSLLDFPIRRVREADIVLLLLTPHALNSYWVLFEALQGIDQQNQLGKLKLLYLSYNLPESSSPKTHFAEAISQNMTVWRERIATRMSQAMQGGDTQKAQAFAEHDQAILQVQSSAQMIADSFAETPHPAYSTETGLPTASELERWLRWVVD